jgi:hypothetical protein
MAWQGLVWLGKARFYIGVKMNNWKRYEDLERVYNFAQGAASNEEHNVKVHVLCWEIAEFLLKPYWDMKKEGKEE